MKSPWWASLPLYNDILSWRLIQEAQFTHHSLILIVINSAVLKFLLLEVQVLGPLQNLLPFHVDVNDFLVGLPAHLFEFSLIISIDLILHPLNLVVVHVFNTRSGSLSVWTSPIVWLARVILDLVPDLGPWRHVLLLIVLAALSLVLDSRHRLPAVSSVSVDGLSCWVIV